MPPLFSVWIIIPVHNRKILTVACLSHLRTTAVLDWAKVVMVDDGSTDGTREIVSVEFPEVQILEGDGNLWWGGGLEKGMRFAYAAGAEAVIWLNDDTLPREGVLEQIVDLSREKGAIVSGASVLDDSFAYGGQNQTVTRLVVIPHLPAETIECDTFRGNLVCVPRGVIDRIGFLRGDLFPHTGGDSDYGLLAKRHGFKNFYARHLQADSLEHDRREADSFLAGEAPLSVLWGRVFQVGQGFYWRSQWWLYVRNWGAVWGIILFVKLYIRLAILSFARLILPLGVRNRMAARHSIAYRFGSSSTNQPKTL